MIVNFCSDFFITAMYSKFIWTSLAIKKSEQDSQEATVEYKHWMKAADTLSKYIRKVWSKFP